MLRELFESGGLVMCNTQDEAASIIMIAYGEGYIVDDLIMGNPGTESLRYMQMVQWMIRDRMSHGPLLIRQVRKHILKVESEPFSEYERNFDAAEILDRFMFNQFND